MGSAGEQRCSDADQGEVLCLVSNTLATDKISGSLQVASERRHLASKSELQLRLLSQKRFQVSDHWDLPDRAVFTSWLVTAHFSHKTTFVSSFAKDTMRLLVLLFLALASSVTAQFGFFDHMFGGGGQQHHGHHHHQQAENVPSDSSMYRAQYARSHCDKYLCPDTLGTIFP